MGFIIEHDTNNKVAIELRRESIGLHYDDDMDDYFCHMEIRIEDVPAFVELLQAQIEE